MSDNDKPEAVAIVGDLSCISEMREGFYLTEREKWLVSLIFDRLISEAADFAKDEALEPANGFDYIKALEGFSRVAETTRDSILSGD